MKRAILIALFMGAIAMAATPQAQVKNIVLVHGAFADGSGWNKVYTILKSHGYNVSIVGNPNTGIEEDVAATNRVLDRQNGPVILVGHSYGGAIISIAGKSPKVAGLVYVAAFSPDEGETLGQLLNSYPSDPKSGILPPVDGFAWYDVKKFHSGFCADIPEADAEFMAAAQVPVAASAFSYVFEKVAWKTKPSWHIAGAEDHSIQPALLKFMAARTHGTLSEIKGGSHVIFISHPKEVADMIETAAKGSGTK